MKLESEILSNLPQFTGTEAYHRFNPLSPKVLLTDGVLWLAENAECYWLMDIIASVQHLPEIKVEGFLSVTYNKKEGRVLIDDGNGIVLYEQEIRSSDFPLNEIQLFVADCELGRIIMLPSEY